MRAMPQFDVTTYPSQLFWLAITFGFFYWLMLTRIVPAIGGTIEARRRRIRDDLDAAERIRAQAEQALADYEAAIAEARRKAREMVAERRREIRAELEAERQRVETELAGKLAAAAERIEAARDEALREIDTAVGELAAEIVARVAGEKVDGEEAREVARRLMD
ncbi:MAG TPA: ATP F0F1 synthase subunit B [Thermopetrobacter sp.]|nr:ATP F0F1 synthase subunit B [Thermopetrobacter sp.]